MELRHLRYFCAVADEMHVTRAAERLHLAQPALTQQIKSLEAELGVELLRRVGRRVELTEAGMAFRREAEAVLERVQSAAYIAQETARGSKGRLSIGLVESAAFAPPVTALLKQARALWPGVETSFLQGRTSDLLGALAERRIDVAFTRAPIPVDDSLHSQSFLSEAIIVAVPSHHPLAARSNVSFTELIDEPLIQPPTARPRR
ncbi:LysR family transcriptional regulator [Bradyrhizobium sp. NAS80.1]|uniref:LysR family transcriptional regulator n=1 Tax=Bradyrhizobium sp. NAS80.1 TaxID=1680159 RepID=UPI000A065EB5|nr:LysR family transcriptional regulator [Bradyrhizobium sp. NAS80.1]